MTKDRSRTRARPWPLWLAVVLLVTVGTPSFLAPMGASTAMSPGAGARASVACTGPNDFNAEYRSSSWPGGFTGVPVYSNGTASYVSNCYDTATTPSGKSVETGMEWQCVELVNRLYITKGWISSHWAGDGDDLYATAPKTTAPKPLLEQLQRSITYLAPGMSSASTGRREVMPPS